METVEILATPRWSQTPRTQRFRIQYNGNFSFIVSAETAKQAIQTATHVATRQSMLNKFISIRKL